MTALHLASCVGYRGYTLGVAERVTCWPLARGGCVGRAILVEGADGHLECHWRGCFLLPVYSFDHGLALVADLV